MDVIQGEQKTWIVSLKNCMILQTQHIIEALCHLPVSPFAEESGIVFKR